jgi:hypothetical protein
VRLIRLHVLSRRTPAAVAAIVACAAVLWLALHGAWDAYGALQLPLVFETAFAAVIAVATASPFGEPERAAGWRLPWLRLGTAVALTALAAAALACSGIGTHLAEGAPTAVRNLAGLVGLGLLTAAAVGGAWAWTVPAAYMILGIYGLYTRWHGPALSTPWIWAARPGGDLGGAICAGLVFAAGLLAVTAVGARDPATPAD